MTVTSASSRLVFALARLYICLIRFTVWSLRCLFFSCSSLCIPAEWKAACGMRLGWEHRLFLLPHREWVCLSDCERVCVTGSDSPKLCAQHSWKVSCLCLQIDMISTHCQKPCTNSHICECLQTNTSLIPFIVSLLLLSGVDFCSKALFTHPGRDSGCLVMLRPTLDEHLSHTDKNTYNTAAAH